VSGNSALLEKFRAMQLIRTFEERAIDLRREGRIHGTIHPYIGQEAVAVGVCAGLKVTDRIASTHRGHGHLLAKGGDPTRMMAELLGRVDGYCRGRGGSMHIADFELGMLGANGIVAAGVPLMLGSAYASAYTGDERVSVAFFGDGATGQGVVWESLLLSSTWQLPVIWVCENNQYAVKTPVSDALPTTDIHRLVSDACMPARVVDGNDVEAVASVAEEAIQRAREGGGPTFIEAVTFRTTWHSFRYASQGDDRSPELRALWASRDPIASVRTRIVESDLATHSELDSIANEIAAEIEEAIVKADASPYPDPSSLADDVFAEAAK
jgi:TPP-dependent pyruvate/acetoin dehydrogenase alpha subunit